MDCDGDDEDKPAEEWLVEAVRRGYLKTVGEGRERYLEWARICTSSFRMPCIVVRVGDSELGPASVGFDSLVMGNHDAAMWNQAVELFRGAAKTTSGNAFVIKSLYGLFGSVAEADAVAQALVGLVVAQRQSGELASDGVGEP